MLIFDLFVDFWLILCLSLYAGAGRSACWLCLYHFLSDSFRFIADTIHFNWSDFDIFLRQSLATHVGDLTLHGLAAEIDTDELGLLGC